MGLRALPAGGGTHDRRRRRGPCVVLAAGSLEHIGEHCNGGAYTFDEAAVRHGAGIEEDGHADDPYAGFEDSRPMPYRDGLLPGD